jgi:putative salt-induced outer membrane protein YdiY
MKKLIPMIVAALGLMFSLSLAHGAGFSNETEASVVITGGNTDVQVYNAKTANSYSKNRNAYLIAGHYTYGTSDDELNTRNWQAKIRYDRELRGQFGVFSAYDYEQDKFRGFIYRQNWDLGGMYKAIASDRQSLNFELGYRFTREKDIFTQKPEDFQKSRYATFYEYRAQKNWSFKFLGEVVLNHTETSDTIVTIEPSLNMILTDRISFKFGYKGIYENQPSVAGLKKYDYQITSGLIAKF